MHEKFIQNLQLEIELSKQAESLLSPNDQELIKIVRECMEAKDVSTNRQMSNDQYENFYFDLIDSIPGANDAYNMLRDEIEKLRVQQFKTSFVM